MTGDSPHLWTIAQLGAAFRSGETSPTETLEILNQRIERIDLSLHSFVTRALDLAMAQASQASEELAMGIDRGPLHGVPITLKDLIEVNGVVTTGGSRLRRGVISTKDAVVVSQLRNAGAVIVGKNSTYEFGTGLPISGDWPEPARNPWDLTRIPGGSSSGSAAAVFSGLSFGAFGTDTGGSIRGPAAYCGVVGLKPSRGIIDIEGVLPLSPTLDHVGPMGRTVDDVRLLLSGGASRALSLPRQTPSLRGAVFGFPAKLIDQARFGPGVVENFWACLDTLHGMGARTEPIDLPESDEVEAALRSFVTSESYAVHAETLSSNPKEYGPSAFERLTAGASTSADSVNQALRTQRSASSQVSLAFEKVDWIVSPVTHTTAPTFSEYEIEPTPRTLFTGIFNLVGAPAISLPAGLDSNMMPIGLQIAGPIGSDGNLLCIAAAIERELSFPTSLSADAHALRRQ